MHPKLERFARGLMLAPVLPLAGLLLDWGLSVASVGGAYWFLHRKV